MGHRTQVDWRGCFPAVVTPFTQDGAIDEAGFQENIRFVIDGGAGGVVVAGCTGESWALEEDEKARLYELGVEAAGGRAPVIAGTPGMTPKQVLRLAERAEAAGAAGIMVQPPACSLPGNDELVDFFGEVAVRARLPVMAYNIPKRVGVSMSPRLIARLAEIDNIVAIKQSSDNADDVIETVDLVSSRLRVFIGYPSKRGFAGTILGVDGFVTSTEPQVFGKEGIDLWHTAAAGNLEEARGIQYRCLQFARAVWGARGTFPAPIKVAMNLLGRPGGYTRPPIKPMDEQGIVEIRSILVELGLLGG